MPGLDIFFRVLIRVPAGSPGGRRGGRRLVHVPSRKRDGKTRRRGPFVHRVCRRFGLEYRHSDPLECGQRRGQRRTDSLQREVVPLA